MGERSRLRLLVFIQLFIYEYISHLFENVSIIFDVMDILLFTDFSN